MYLTLYTKVNIFTFNKYFVQQVITPFFFDRILIEKYMLSRAV